MTSDMVGFFKIMHPVMLNYKQYIQIYKYIQIYTNTNYKQTIQHNFIKYSFNHMFRSYGIITRPTFTTY